MKANTQTLRYIVYGIILLSASILLNDMREFEFNRFQEFISWAKTADPNESWFTSKNAIEWSYYAVSAAIFFWKGYLIYSFTYFLKILNKVEEGLYFDNTVIKQFEKLGKVFIYYTINVVVLKYIMSLIQSNDFKFIDAFKSELTYMIPAGLAFYVMAGIFKKAKELQEENDLTI